jgi:CheY-like chemotaxis protein
VSVTLAPCGPAHADRSLLETALLNLAINARDAMAGRGRLSIEVGEALIEAPLAAARAVAPGPYVRLAVQDTGCGMAPEVADRAFDPFFTTKPVGEGTGLGLSMAYAFARQAGGDAWIDSTPGVGTTVGLLLPRLAPETTARPDPVPARDLATTGRGEIILIVEDDAAIRTLFAEALAASGYRVLTAGDGATALRLLRGEPAPELLIADVGLPGDLDGRQVFEAARAILPRLAGLFITGYADAEACGRLEPSMVRLHKPFEMDTLRRAVDEVLRAA